MRAWVGWVGEVDEGTQETVRGEGDEAWRGRDG